MAKTETTTEAAPKPAAAPMDRMAVVGPLLGWLVPGAGHLIQKRWLRGVILMISVMTMFVLGLAMNGKIYQPNTGDLLDMLGFVGDVGAGGLYILGRIMEWGGKDITSATADYGTKYMVAAGLLNVMVIVDAYHIARRRKP